jgi:4-hydroxybenzoate polyprenyltransferase
MSFTEIIHWGVLAITLLMGTVYALLARQVSTVDEIAGLLLIAMIVLVIAVVLFSSIVAIPMAIRSKGNLADERDDAMEAGAMPYTFSVLVIGSVWAVIDIITRGRQDQAMDPVLTVNILLGSLFFAVVTGSVVTLIRYRLGPR